MSTRFSTIRGIHRHPRGASATLFEYTLELSCGHYVKAVSFKQPGNQVVCPRCSNLEAVTIPVEPPQAQAA